MERNDLLQAALELHHEIRCWAAWEAVGAEPSVARAHAIKIADKWKPILEEISQDAKK